MKDIKIVTDPSFYSICYTLQALFAEGYKIDEKNAPMALGPYYQVNLVLEDDAVVYSPQKPPEQPTVDFNVVVDSSLAKGPSEASERVVEAIAKRRGRPFKDNKGNV